MNRKELIEAYWAAVQEREDAWNTFNSVTDFDLIDMAIARILAADAKCNYLQKVLLRKEGAAGWGQQ